MNKNTILDLHNLNGYGQSISENDVWLALDKFITKIKTHNINKINAEIGVEVTLVVGKGLKTKNFMEDKNPLRFYTENYLNKCGYSWRNGGYYEGENGVIIAQIV